VRRYERSQLPRMSWSSCPKAKAPIRQCRYTHNLPGCPGEVGVDARASAHRYECRQLPRMSWSSWPEAEASIRGCRYAPNLPGCPGEVGWWSETEFVPISDRSTRRVFKHTLFAIVCPIIGRDVTHRQRRNSPGPLIAPPKWPL